MRLGVLWLVVGLGGCGGASLGDCPPDSMAAQVAGRRVVEQRCVSCHSSTLMGAARQKAPPDINFNTLAGVRQELESSWAQANDGKMPPGAKLSDADITSLQAFLACGAPDVQ